MTTIDLNNIHRQSLVARNWTETMETDKYGDFVSFDDLAKLLLDLGFKVKSIETENDENYWERFWNKVAELRAAAIDTTLDNR